jgi:hypothetical protein
MNVCLAFTLSKANGILRSDSSYVWVLTVMWVAGAAYRWYVGLEWFGFSPGNSVYVAIIAMVTGLALYVVWVQREVQRVKSELKTDGQVQSTVSE